MFMNYINRMYDVCSLWVIVYAKLQDDVNYQEKLLVKYYIYIFTV